MKALGNHKKGILFVVSAPAGTGKTTLVQMLSDEFSCVVKSVSYTTRPIRPKEIVGVDYHYLSNAEFEQRIEEGEFLEYAKVFGFYYGTSRKFVNHHLNLGQHVILVIDTQGAMQLKGKIYHARLGFGNLEGYQSGPSLNDPSSDILIQYPPPHDPSNLDPSETLQNSENLTVVGIDARFIFISPPSIEELRKRLRGRKTDSEEAIEQRLSWAEREMKLASHYDYHIVNENLNIAYDVLRSILIAEEHKNH